MKDIKKLFIGLFIFTLLIINFLAVAQESVDEEFTEQLESTPPTLKERFLAIEREKEELLFKSKKFPLPNDNHLALLDSQESIDEKEVSEAPLTLKEITLVDKYNFSEATSEAEESLDLNSFPLPNDNHLATSDFQEDIALNINVILNTNTDKKEELLFKYYVVEAIESYQEVNEALGLNHDNSIYIAVPAVPVLLYATHKAVQLGEGAVRSITPDKRLLIEKVRNKKFLDNFISTNTQLDALLDKQAKLKKSRLVDDARMKEVTDNMKRARVQLENQKQLRFLFLQYKAGRLLRGVGLGVITIAGISVATALAGDVVYITFDTFSDMDALKDRYDSDIQDIISSAQR